MRNPWDRVVNALGEEEWHKLGVRIQAMANLHSLGVVDHDFIHIQLLQEIDNLKDKFAAEEWDELRNSLQTDIETQRLFLILMGYTNDTDPKI